MPTPEQLRQLDPQSSHYATDFVDKLLAGAMRVGCSDVHLLPEADGISVRWRVDGVLQLVGQFPSGGKTDIVTRLKVMAGLLTYQSDAPQEGRLRDGLADVEMRVSTIPTVFGERAVVRLFGSNEDHQTLAQLGLPAEVQESLTRSLQETSGAILITGPAGSGKTTTAYACLRDLVTRSAGGRNIVSLEDPVEVVIPGVSQSQASPSNGFTLSSGLKSILRQDPEVILLGEIRDRETAQVAFQAALTGQLVISTFHAGSSAEAISRLIEMDVEPYILRSALQGVVSQRLVRRLCNCCLKSTDERDFLGLPTSLVSIAAACEACGQTGYQGRVVLAELLSSDSFPMKQAIQARQDAATIDALAREHGMKSLWDRGLELVESEDTSPAEVRRVLGWRERHS